MSKKNSMVASYMKFCREMNKCGFQVFASYSGHVDAIHTHFHPGNWNETEPVKVGTISLDGDKYYKEIADAKKQITESFNAYINGEEMPVTKFDFPF